jgi:hypothetical protein
MVICFKKSLPSKLLRVIITSWLVISHVFSHSAVAEDDLSIIEYVPNVFSLDYGTNSDEGRNIYVYSNFAVALQHRIVLAIGDQEETLSISTERIENDTYLLGYAYQSFHSLQGGAEYEYWGNSAAVTSNSYRFHVAYDAGNFGVILTPEFRQIKINANSQCNGDIDSGAIKLHIKYNFIDNLTINTSYTSFDYSGNLTKLGECVPTEQFVVVTSRMQSVADDKAVSAGIDYYWDTETFGIGYYWAKSAIVTSQTRVISLYGSTDRFGDWSITLSGGVQENLDNSMTEFLTGSLTYYW